MKGCSRQRLVLELHETTWFVSASEDLTIPANAQNLKVVSFLAYLRRIQAKDNFSLHNIAATDETAVGLEAESSKTITGEKTVSLFSTEHDKQVSNFQ